MLIDEIQELKKGKRGWQNTKWKRQKKDEKKQEQGETEENKKEKIRREKRKRKRRRKKQGGSEDMIVIKLRLMYRKRNIRSLSYMNGNIPIWAWLHYLWLCK